MNWFKSRAALLAELEEAKVQIRKLEAELNDTGEGYQNVTQSLNEAERKVEKMILMRDPAQVDTAALQVAVNIEDLFVRKGLGRDQLLERVQTLVIGAIQEAIKGEEDWNLDYRKKHTDT